MLEIRSLRKSIGDRDLLLDVGMTVTEGQRVALIGVNGVGKSTLLKIILGTIEPDGGETRLAPWASVAYLPQDAHCASQHTLHEELLSVFQRVRALEDRQRALEAGMHGLAPEDPRLMAMVAEHSALHEEFERLGGYTIEAEIGKVLSGLGFSRADRDKRAGDFSGGWQMRIALAKLLLERPSLLLLDEPTNHLDLAATTWLEEYLREYRGAVIVVSHDRYFLDRVAQRTMELSEGKVKEWPGNYTYYVTEKQKSLAAQEAAYKRQQEYITDQQAFVERFRASARRSTQAKSREKALDKLERVAPPPKVGHGRFRFAAHRPSGREVFMLKGVAKGYDGRTVFAECELLIERGDKIALVGENGTGKTTLLRILAGLERPDKGSFRLGINVERSYYAQHQADILNEAQTVFDDLYGAAPPDWTTVDVRKLLGRFQISDDEVFKSISVLSGGERSRLALAKMLLRPANVLLLDEPTNHLDIPAREMLEEALRAYEGTVVLVSHDRYFVDRVATKIVELAEERVRAYGGNYTYYLFKKAKEAEQAAAAPREKAVERERVANKKAAAIRQLSPEKQLVTVERDIAALEEELRRLSEELANPGGYEDQERAASLLNEYNTLSERLAEQNERWEELARAVEEAASASA